MGKLGTFNKFRYGQLLIFLLPLTTTVYACSRFKEPRVLPVAHGANSEILGTVSVPIYNTLGIKNEESIARQLDSEAQKLYPQGNAITNIRYDKTIAYADVVK